MIIVRITKGGGESDDENDNTQMGGRWISEEDGKSNRRRYRKAMENKKKQKENMIHKLLGNVPRSISIINWRNGKIYNANKNSFLGRNYKGGEFKNFLKSDSTIIIRKLRKD